MTYIRLVIILIVLFSLTNCEKKDDLINTTTNAQVVGFVTEKCFCCWGWVIKIGSDTIKADSIPNLKPLADTIFPINGIIKIGSITGVCGQTIDYYEIKEFLLVK
jgi:hypothetical protein